MYARAAQVSLKLNGIVLEKKKVPSNLVTRFSVPWQPGVLTASVLDEHGAPVGSCRLQSLGKKTFLSVLPEKPKASPGEICFIRLRYTDEYGDVLPRERGLLQIDVEGCELLGMGSACPYNPLGFTGSRTDTYYGEALAVIRAGGDSPVRISATDGTYTGSAVIPVAESSE